MTSSLKINTYVMFYPAEPFHTVHICQYISHAELYKKGIKQLKIQWLNIAQIFCLQSNNHVLVLSK